MFGSWPKWCFWHLGQSTKNDWDSLICTCRHALLSCPHPFHHSTHPSSLWCLISLGCWMLTNDVDLHSSKVKRINKRLGHFLVTQSPIKPRKVQCIVTSKSAFYEYHLKKKPLPDLSVSPIKALPQTIHQSRSEIQQHLLSPTRHSFLCQIVADPHIQTVARQGP